MTGGPSRITFTLNGNTFELDRDRVVAKLKTVAPEAIRQHGVRIAGTVFPVKQAFELAAELPRQNFTSHTARRHLASLGFEIIGDIQSRDVVEPAFNSARVPSPTAPPAGQVLGVSAVGDLILVTCVKEKLATPAAARDLYISALFHRERAYAETSGKSWFILSAEHGLVAPDEWLAPYERYLPETSHSYRTVWGSWVAERLELLAGPLAGRVLEVHAGSAYLDAIRSPLTAKGASVVEPLNGLTLGQRLAWYNERAAATAGQTPSSAEVHGAAAEFCRRLMVEADAVGPSDFLARGASGLKVPGLYSWWVDRPGAEDLTQGIGHQIETGLIYAGLAGATRWPSGKLSSNTLWSRIAGMHLGKKHEFSTFRRTIGSILASASGARTIDESALTDWMNRHLKVLAIPFEDADTLGRLEESVLSAIDPPLNLKGMVQSPVRDRLRELRHAHGGARRT